MIHTTEQLEKMLADATPGPWRKSPQDGACVIGSSGYIGHFAANRNVKADTRLTAAAPTITAELIAARKRIAELEAIIALIDAKAPRADNSCAEPGITLSEAARRELACTP